jgi:hypothetical protein
MAAWFNETGESYPRLQDGELGATIPPERVLLIRPTTAQKTKSSSQDWVGFRGRYNTDNE